MDEVLYSIKENRFKQAYIEGFEIEGNSIKTIEAIHQCLYLKPLNGGNDEATWGRLFFKESHSDATNYLVYIAASDELITPDEDTIAANRRMIMDTLGGKRYVNQSDILLYEFTGRYLYIGLEAISQDVPNLTISGMAVDKIGDNFMNTFPQIYHERNSYFHRLMSVYSTIYNNMEAEIANLPKLLDLDNCPAELLPIYGKWLGIDVGDGFLEETVLRSLVKEAYQLNRMKGTSWCLERISEILLGNKGLVVERNRLEEFLSDTQMSDYKSLYGDNIYDVSLLVRGTIKPALRSQLQYILDQFLPIRCRLHIIELDQMGSLGSHVYLDINAKVYQTSEGALDKSQALDGMMILQ